MQGVASINLCTTDGVSVAVPVGTLNKLSATIIPGTAYSSSSWVVDLQWSLMLSDYEKWITFSPAFQWTSTVFGVLAVSVTNCGHVRWKTTTAQPASDPAASVAWSLR